MAVPGHPPDCRVAKQFDVGGLFDPAGEIARHTLVEIFTSNEHKHFLGAQSKVHDRLSSRVAAPNHDYGRMFVQVRVYGEGRIVDACSLETFTALRVEAAILSPRGDEHRTGPQFLAAFEFEHPNITVDRMFIAHADCR